MNKKVVFTEEQIKNIIEYYQYPHSLNDTTKFAGITKSKIIHDLLIAHNIPLHNKALAKQLQWNKQQEYFKEVSGKTLAALSNDMNLKEQITKDYIINNMQFKDLLLKYGLSYKMLGGLLKAWGIRKEKMKQTDNITKNKLLKYNINKQKLQEYFDTHTIMQCVDYFKIPEKFFYKIAKTYTIDWTAHKKNVYNGSVPEDEYYFQLIIEYGEENVFRQYTDKRYPFNCDFYIKSEDLFIELNYHWTHGKHPFDANSQEDQNKLQIWTERAKNSAYYKGAIEVWTVRDPLKLAYFKKNNLNYKILY